MLPNNAYGFEEKSNRIFILFCASLLSLLLLSRPSSTKRAVGSGTFRIAAWAITESDESETLSLADSPHLSTLLFLVAADVRIMEKYNVLNYFRSERSIKLVSFILINKTIELNEWSIKRYKLIAVSCQCSCFHCWSLQARLKTIRRKRPLRRLVRRAERSARGPLSRCVFPLVSHLSRVAGLLAETFSWHSVSRLEMQTTSFEAGENKGLLVNGRGIHS